MLWNSVTESPGIKLEGWGQEKKKNQPKNKYTPYNQKYTDTWPALPYMVLHQTVTVSVMEEAWRMQDTMFEVHNCLEWLCIAAALQFSFV